MKSDLIIFRAQVTPGRAYGVNYSISFPDGHEGIIRSIIEVEVFSNGTVFVIGKYRRLERGKP